MAVISVILDGISYQVKFGYGAFKALAFAWDLKGIQAVANKIQAAFPDEGTQDLLFEQADLMGDLVIAGIENANKELVGQLDRDAVVQSLLFETPETLEVIMEAFAQSFPKGGKPQPGPKARKATRKK